MKKPRPKGLIRLAYKAFRDLNSGLKSHLQPAGETGCSGNHKDQKANKSDLPYSFPRK